jgi:phage terminase large subunit
MRKMARINLKEIIAPHFWNTFNSKKPHQIYAGGRASTKTSQIAIKIDEFNLEYTECNAIIIKRYQNTIRNSVFKEIKRALKRLGLQEDIDYKATVSPFQIHIYQTGNNIYFAGGDDYEKVKGFIDEDAPIKMVWFEELTEFDEPDQIDQIIATFSRGNDDFFITMYSYNPPKNRFHWVNIWADKMKLRDDVLFSHTDYRTVPEKWLGKKFIEEAERLKQYDEKRYRWIYLGEVIGIEGLIYNPDLFIIENANYIEEKKLRILYVDFAIDCGHQTSATSCGAYGYATDGRWYRLDTYYYSPHEKSRKKAPSELAQDIFNFRTYILKKYKTICDTETIDSAEGALRNQYFAMFGIKLTPVNKGKDKEELIEYSQDFLDTGKYVILDVPNNWIHIKEMKNYMWVKDSVEKGKPVPDKEEKELTGETYYNTHTNDYSYYYAEHSCDDFQYYVKNNLQKLGLEA